MGYQQQKSPDRETMTNLDAIRDSDIATAVAMNDLDEACAFLQGIAGITTGDVAAACFSDVTFDWSRSGLAEREAMIRNWLRTERVYQ